MLSCVSQLLFFLIVRVGIQKGYAGHCLVEGRGGKLDLLSALTIPHAFGCTGSLFRTSNDALGFNRDIGCCKVSAASGSIGSTIFKSFG